MDQPETSNQPSNQEPATDNITQPTPEVETIPPPTSEPTEAGSEVKPRKNKRKLVIIVAIVVVILAALGGGAFALFHKPATPAQKAASVPAATKTEVKAETKTDFTVTKLANGNSQIEDRIWYKTPVAVDASKVQFLKADDMVTKYCEQPGGNCTDKQMTVEPAFKFYEVGEFKTDGNKFIVAVPQTIEHSAYLLISDKGTNFTVLGKHSPYFYNTEGKPYLTEVGSHTTINNTTTYPELVAPKTLTLNGKAFNLVKEETDPLVGDNTLDGKTYASTDLGDVVQVKKDGGNTYQPMQYSLQRYSFIAVDYQPAPTPGDLKAGEVTFQDKSKSTVIYTPGFHGCGFGNNLYDVITDVSFKYTEAGSTKDGVTLYTMQNPENSDIFSDTLKDYNDSFADDSSHAPYPAPMSMATFLAKKPILFFQNSLGQYQALYDQNFIVAGGCGKPVVYLYPAKPTAVSVKVDADIRVSEPAYNQGWNVMAMPNGTLFGRGGIYDSLYWEGYGHEYPEITNGTVVAQADLVSTIQSQLKELGLNSKEASDFQAFWLPKLPRTPYVRLTWFGTSQLDRLAPMHITPTPDTVIRVFLDYEGLSQPLDLPVQHLGSIERRGFTVVEWGGLLHGAIH